MGVFRVGGVFKRIDLAIRSTKMLHNGKQIEEIKKGGKKKSNKKRRDVSVLRLNEIWNKPSSDNR